MYDRLPADVEQAVRRNEAIGQVLDSWDSDLIQQVGVRGGGKGVL